LGEFLLTTLSSRWYFENIFGYPLWVPNITNLVLLNFLTPKLKFFGISEFPPILPFFHVVMTYSPHRFLYSSPSIVFINTTHYHCTNFPTSLFFNFPSKTIFFSPSPLSFSSFKKLKNHNNKNKKNNSPKSNNLLAKVSLRKQLVVQFFVLFVKRSPTLRKLFGLKSSLITRNVLNAPVARRKLKVSMLQSLTINFIAAVVLLRLVLTVNKRKSSGLQKHLVLNPLLTHNLLV